MITKLSKLLFAVLITSYTVTFAQTTTVLNFGNNEAIKWDDGVAEDGDGGSSDIAGITLQVYNITDNSGTKLVSKIKWYNNTDLSSSAPTYNAITEDFDSSAGSKGMAIKSKDNKIFNLNSFIWYDWGFTDGAIVTVDGYLNGVKTVTTTFQSNTEISQGVSAPVNVSFSATPINNIDEVRMTFSSNNRYPSINKISVTTNVTLPVSILNFEAKRENSSGVLLNWNTSSELNNKQFILKHSLDGKNFETIITTNSKGANANKYSFNHSNASNSLNYYELLQEDYDGTVQSLGIKSVSAIFDTQVSVYPNPTKDYTIVQFKAGLFNNATLLDLNGKTIQDFVVSPMLNNIKFDLRNLAPGTYIVELKGETSRIVKKISIL
ncbi:T9SS type A sorting domain-containing protein [Pedobacter arcticus]|uniref:T9SS type A sorting domain-containing protein n=1 Tax=Pedobacter arcticus TaxID=752140 RepID=UPI00030E7D25|nr:T9SS type A sorting domain-containing protein [Pedobacter arcticus]